MFPTTWGLKYVKRKRILHDRLDNWNPQSAAETREKLEWSRCGDSLQPIRNLHDSEAFITLCSLIESSWCRPERLGWGQNWRRGNFSALEKSCRPWINTQSRVCGNRGSNFCYRHHYRSVNAAITCNNSFYQLWVNLQFLTTFPACDLKMSFLSSFWVHLHSNPTK